MVNKRTFELSNMRQLNKDMTQNQGAKKIECFWGNHKSTDFLMFHNFNELRAMKIRD